MRVQDKFYMRAALRRAPLVCALGMAMAVLSLPAQAVLDRKSVDERATRAVAAVQSTMQRGAMQSGEALGIRSAEVTPQGRTVVHAHQTVNGHRVWGSSVIVHADPAAAPRTVGKTQLQSVRPAGTPRLSESQAITVAMNALALKGSALSSKAELVVFPTSKQTGLQMVWNAGTKRYELDRQRSTLPAKGQDPYVWAYDVHVLAKNSKDGLKDIRYVVDARNGSILKVVDEVRGLAEPNPPAQLDTDIAVKGIGYSQYSGTVTLDTTRRADGTYSMIDRTRGSNFVPIFNDGRYINPETFTPYLDELGNPIAIIGLQAMAERHEGSNWDYKANWYWLDKNTTNVWGDGQAFAGYPFGNETSVNGQTASVDAHFGLATTWDFFKNIFVRNGLDDQGGS